MLFSYLAQELKASEYALYYFNSKKYGELDFLIEHKGQLMAIEVKSGKGYRKHNALDNCLKCKEFNVNKAIVFCHDNVQIDGIVIYMPIYMTMFIHQHQQTEPIIYKLDLEGLK